MNPTPIEVMCSVQKGVKSAESPSITYSSFTHLKTQRNKEIICRTLMRTVQSPLPYIKRCRLAPSSHRGRCTLIREAGTPTPQMQRCATHTRLASVLLLTYPQVQAQDSFQFVVGRLAMCFNVASASTPIRPSTETTKGVTYQQCLSQKSIQFFFFALSAVSRHFSGDLDFQEVASVFTARMQ